MYILSLKGKDEHIGEEYKFYNTEDIEMLRKKLIEDVMDYYDRYLKYQIDENPNRHNFNYDIKKIINKCFGVE